MLWAFDKYNYLTSFLTDPLKSFLPKINVVCPIVFWLCKPGPP
jgi:hypothetical protein